MRCLHLMRVLGVTVARTEANTGEIVEQSIP